MHYKMNVECAGIWNHLEHPVSGENPYLEAIERNLSIIRKRVAQLDRQSGAGAAAAIASRA